MVVNISRMKALWPWLAEARFAWLTFGVIAVALTVALRPHATEEVIRLTGLILQVLGIGTVTWGISETRALFGHPSLASKAKSWLGRFPLLKRNIVLGAAACSMAAATGKMRGFVTQDPGTNPTLATRVDALEKNVTLIHERITSTQNEMDEGFNRAAESLKTEERARQAEDVALRAKLEATGTGGVHISAIGASWLFVGVVLSTASLEIAELLK